jgi:hypothetical protein
LNYFSRFDILQGDCNLKKALLLYAYCAGICSVLVLILSRGWLDAWSKLGLPSLVPYFADLRTIQGAIFSESAGFNPQQMNPGDPWDRIMNYPLVWLDLAKILRLSDESHFLVFGLVLIVCFLLATAELLRRYPSFLLLLLLFSGSSLLAVERGNNDLFVFVLVFVSLVLPRVWQPFIIFFAVGLKAYPIFSILSFSQSKRGWIATTFLFLLATASLIPQYGNISRGNTGGGYLSYGLKTNMQFFEKFQEHAFSKYNNLSKMVIVGLLLAIFVLVIACIWVLRWRLNEALQVSRDSSFHKKIEVRMFLAGAGIYCGTFVMSSNWDYRLIFLLLCIPFLQTTNQFLYRNVLPLAILAAMNLPILELLPTKHGPLLGVLLNQFSKNVIFLLLSVVLLQLVLGFARISRTLRN